MKEPRLPFDRCAFIMAARRVRRGEFIYKVQCLFQSSRDGFCKRHHPEVRRNSLVSKILRLRRQLAEAEQTLKAMK